MTAPKRHYISDDDLLAAVKEHGSATKAAKALGCNRRNVDKRLKRLAARGYAPEHDMTKTVPDGYLVKGVSTYYNAHGEVTGQWVKSAVDHELLQKMLMETVKAMAEDIPHSKPVKAPYRTIEELLNLYVITLACWHGMRKPATTGIPI